MTSTWAKWVLSAFVVSGLLVVVSFGAYAQQRNSANPANSSLLYATASDALGNRILITIDLSSHTVTEIGTIGYPQAFAFAFSPAATAYTITNFPKTSAQLATVDLNSGAATLVGEPLGSDPFNMALQGPMLQVMGMIFSPEGALYAGAMSPMNTAIYAIDTATGQPAFVGSSSTAGELMSFAYSPQGVLYGATQTDLYTVDLSTGISTHVSPLSIASKQVMGLAIDNSGTMYAADFVACTKGCSNIYQVDPLTGIATTLFNTGYSQVHNIAFNPGSPSDQLFTLLARIPLQGLPNGIANSLSAKASAALNAANSGDAPTACNILGAFTNEVSALTDKHIPELAAQEFAFRTTRLRTTLGCY